MSRLALGPVFALLALAVGCGSAGNGSGETGAHPQTATTSQSATAKLGKPIAVLRFSGRTSHGMSASVTVRAYRYARFGHVPTLPYSGRDSVRTCRTADANDVVIPVTLSMKNTGRGAPVAIGAKGFIDANPNAREWIELDGEYSDGVPICRHPGDGIPWLTLAEPVKPGEAVNNDFFLVVHDFFSRKHPRGDRAFLRTVTMNVDPALGHGEESFVKEPPVFHLQ